MSLSHIAKAFVPLVDMEGGGEGASGEKVPEGRKEVPGGRKEVPEGRKEHDKLLFRLARLLQEKGGLEGGSGLTMNGSSGLQPQGLAHLATLFARGGQMTSDR